MGKIQKLQELTRGIYNNELDKIGYTKEEVQEVYKRKVVEKEEPSSSIEEDLKFTKNVKHK